MPDDEAREETGAASSPDGAPDQPEHDLWDDLYDNPEHDLRSTAAVGAVGESGADDIDSEMPVPPPPLDDFEEGPRTARRRKTERDRRGRMVMAAIFGAGVLATVTIAVAAWTLQVPEQSATGPRPEFPSSGDTLGSESPDSSPSVSPSASPVPSLSPSASEPVPSAPPETRAPTEDAEPADTDTEEPEPGGDAQQPPSPNPGGGTHKPTAKPPQPTETPGDGDGDGDGDDDDNGCWLPPLIC